MSIDNENNARHLMESARLLGSQSVGGGAVPPANSVWFNMEGSLRSIAHSLHVLAVNSHREAGS